MQVMKMNQDKDIDNDRLQYLFYDNLIDAKVEENSSNNCLS